VVDEVFRARGLRYACAERFQRAVLAPPWDGTLDASPRAVACPQAEYRLSSVTGPITAGMTFDEDCLRLGVTAPSGSKGRRPVMVWFHGGAYLSGGGEAAAYDPSELVTQEGVVVVSVSCRLGIFGFLGIDGVAPPNLGLHDQILALRWVRANIAAFGGDPDNVTIFGQSSGACSVFCLMIAEGTAGLFKRAILQSPPLFFLGPHRDAMHAAMSRAAQETLRGHGAYATAGQVLEAQAAALVHARAFGAQSAMAFGPQLGRDPLPTAAKLAERVADAARRIEVMIGWTEHDASPFLALDARLAPLMKRRVARRFVAGALTPLVTRRVFAGPAAALARKLRAAGGRVLEYRFAWRPDDSDLGACHCIELPFLLGSADAWRGAPMLGSSYERDVARLGRQMKALWARFARDGVGENERRAVLR